MTVGEMDWSGLWRKSGGLGEKSKVLIDNCTVAVLRRSRVLDSGEGVVDKIGRVGGRVPEAMRLEA